MRLDLTPIRAAGWIVPLVGAPLCAAPPEVGADIVDVLPEFRWGYKTGVKQPVGSFLDGRSIHILALAPDATSGGLGRGDQIMWVDERPLDDPGCNCPAEVGISIDPTGNWGVDQLNPGGQTVYSPDGLVWHAFGAHLPENPMQLHRSTEPFDVSSFDRVVDAYVLSPSGSTTPLVAADTTHTTILWRHGPSTGINTEVRARIYDRDRMDAPLREFPLAKGEMSESMGRLGIEQLWLRHDPRHDAICATWQWFDVGLHRFGSTPFLVSHNMGERWELADGGVPSGYPIEYTNARAQANLIPVDHLRQGLDTDWFPAEIGLSPRGAPWMAQLVRDPANETGRIEFMRFADGAWSVQTLVDSPQRFSKAYACGATLDGLVLAYADADEPSKLKIRYSNDDGARWSAPIVIAELQGSGPDAEQIAWVSFVQPAARYDRHARFFFSSYRPSENINNWASNYMNRVRFARVAPPARCVADLTASSRPGAPGFGVPDGDVDADDLFFYLDQFAGANLLLGDLTASDNPNDPGFGVPDGDIDAADFFFFLDAFAKGCRVSSIGR